MTAPSTWIRVAKDPLYVPTPPLDPPGGHRFDDPLGLFVVRYLAADLYGSLLEAMAWLRRESTADKAVRSQPEDTNEPLVPVGVGAHGVIRVRLTRDPLADGLEDWLVTTHVGHFEVPQAPYVDVNDAAVLSRYASNPSVKAAVAASGVDPSGNAVLDEALVRLAGARGRVITQALSRAIWEAEPETAGVMFKSRFDDRVRCLALYADRVAPSPLAVERLGAGSPDHRLAAQLAAALHDIHLPSLWLQV